MSKIEKKHKSRISRKKRVRKVIQGTMDKPRLCVFKSLKYTYAQLIADDNKSVIHSISTKTLDTNGASRSSKESAKSLGEAIAKVAKDKEINSVVFDRNGYKYHGRVAAVAEGARETGLIF